MEQIVIQVADKKKAQILLQLLESLSFVDSVESRSNVDEYVSPNVVDKVEDFFAIAGIWESSNISLNKIREEAWPQQQI
ncbi:MAG: hypothetical protein H6668_02055 [Ardenticatenaceae bacterium]|nr:hypothetical protein [Ardenticatenaceae bacterium]